MNSNVTLQQLIYIVAVDARGSFVEAAEECKVSQPALSMQIRKLENTLGVSVFDRGRQPVRATEIGRRIIAQARLVLREAGRLQEAVEIAQGEMKGEYRLGVSRSIASWLLPAMLRQFADEHPDVSLTVRELSLEEVAEGLKRDRIDAAIMPLSVSVDTFVERTLYYEPLLAYVPRTHHLYDMERLSLSDIAPSDVLLPARTDPLREQIIHLFEDTGSDSFSSLVRWEGGTLDALRRLSEEGLGITLMPRLAADEIRATGTADMLREFLPPAPYRTVGLVLTGSHTKGHITDVVATMILGLIPPSLLEKPI